jgi:predicted DCC family thiol-disulfide oxidoreductase YuxK
MPVLLYDGSCGLCDRAVQFVLAHDTDQQFKFAPLQGAYAAAVRARHPALRGVDSLVLVEDAGGATGPSVRVRSDAVIRVAELLGWPWRAAGMLQLVPRALRDGAYDLVARRRHSAWRPDPACLLPRDGDAARFIA